MAARIVLFAEITNAVEARVYAPDVSPRGVRMISRRYVVIDAAAPWRICQHS